MNRTLKLHDYLGKDHMFIVNDIEHLLCMIKYECSGDECALVVYVDGTNDCLDSDIEHERLMGFGPEYIEVLLPDQIQWEDTPYDA